jgi:hypothetical protein
VFELLHDGVDDSLVMALDGFSACFDDSLLGFQNFNKKVVQGLSASHCFADKVVHRFCPCHCVHPTCEHKWQMSGSPFFLHLEELSQKLGFMTIKQV